MTPLIPVLLPLALLGLVLGALLSAADAALLATNRARLDRELDDRPERIRRRALRQYDDAPRTFASITLGRIASEVLLVVGITGMIFALIDRDLVATLVALLVSVTVAFLGVSVSPRTLGRREPEKVAVRLSGLISVTRQLLGLPSGLLIHIGSAFTPGGKVHGGPYATEAELRHFVDRATENDELEHDERDMIRGVFDLGGTHIRELMVPRTDMVTISADASAEKAIRLFVRSGHSRIPVIGDSVDDLLGMLYVKDVMRAVHSPWDPRPAIPVTEVMRPAQFVPEFVGADDVLRMMQTSRVHVAIIVDEYGGVSGIVTIEDVLEEIVGDIADEHDRTEPEIEDLGEGAFRVPSRETVSTVGELFGLEIEDDDVDTVGGLLAKALGKVPVVGAEADAHGLHMVAEKTSGRRKRVSTLLVTRTPRTEETAEDDSGRHEDRREERREDRREEVSGPEDHEDRHESHRDGHTESRIALRAEGSRRADRTLGAEEDA
ncbi:HlyC/CorC family transporter [Brachybacterium sp. EF45031]|uniref:hemolysin family protein n=1 Tax=Brachybacterium sillae TaxID=2810536 RepID=UPI00217E1EE8|nr:hemolysin family protein [Brachybacterium sillae]MCS6710762.1 HlyC/CorC family transporter [Brachybacterium sillae]